MKTVGSLSGSRRCCCAPARAAPPPPAPAPPPPPPPPPTPTSNSKRWRSAICDEVPGAVAGRRHQPRRSSVRRPARRRQRRRLAGAAGFHRALSSGARAHRPQQAVARQPGRCAAAARTSSSTTAGNSQTLEDWRWNPLIYTRIAGDALYNLLARDFAPAPERLQNARQAARRIAALPRAGARGAGTRRACRRSTRKPR